MNFVELTNSEGKKISVCFRSFQPQDAEGIINVITDEYGKTYIKRNFYNLNTFEKYEKSGHTRFIIAELKYGKIIGMISLNDFLPREKVYEPASAVVLKEYRQYGIFKHLVEKALKIEEKTKNMYACYVHVIMYHDITQRVFEEIGFTPCGITYSELLMLNSSHSYQRDENIKYPYGIMMRKAERKDVGKIYIPPEHIEIAQKIYNSLSVKFEITSKSEKLSGKTSIFIEDDEPQQRCTIAVDEIGTDLIAKVKEIQNERKEPYQIFNLYLNISDPKAITAYKELLKIGYFFTGFRPLCSDRELIVMHNPCKVQINFDTFKLTQKFSELNDYIKKCYERRIK